MIGEFDRQPSETGSIISTDNGTLHDNSGCKTASSVDSAQTEQNANLIDEYNIGEANSSVDTANGKEFENLICAEIFSGSCRLTASIRKLGMRAAAFDRTSNRTSGPVTNLDLIQRKKIRFSDELYQV